MAVRQWVCADASSVNLSSSSLSSVVGRRAIEKHYN